MYVYINFPRIVRYEGPSGQNMSIAGQVQYVISEARDPKNLCKIFPGWTPWV
jgi:ataxia telangiectasia mutated family protein